MLKKERYNNHYDAFFSDDSKRIHENIKDMNSDRLLTELDDVVQVLTLLDNADFAELSTTKAGRLYRLMLSEIRNRLS